VTRVKRGDVLCQIHWNDETRLGTPDRSIEQCIRDKNAVRERTAADTRNTRRLNMKYESVEQAKSHLLDKMARLRIAIIMGSGLSAVDEILYWERSGPLRFHPTFSRSKVRDIAARLFSAKYAMSPCVFEGRVHNYEGLHA
jgi:hypothetical protein